MLAILTGLALAAGTPGPADPDTKAWWAITAALSNDAMEGRDTGSEAYERAARMVAERFARAGLKPAGENGGWFQRVPMEEIAVDPDGTWIDADALHHGALPENTVSAPPPPIPFLSRITVTPAPGMAETLHAPIAFRGYCAPDALGDVRGKAVICWGTHRAGLPDDAARLAAAKVAGAAAIVTVADPGFTVEPPRWPFAYARTVWLAGSAPPPAPMVRLTLDVAVLFHLLYEGGHDVAQIVADGSAGRPLPSFDPPRLLDAHFKITHRTLSAPNVLAMLPGTDSAKAGETIVLSAHLDGYGHGMPVAGDGLYNGTLDDAAYVALLIRLAERRDGHGFRRPVLFAAFTGEEKGLLGARWFVAHPTLPKAAIAADINLDQLRPIFPLDLLTVHALDDTTLGDDVRAVTAPRHIAVQRDPEPERNLLRRADQWPFLQAGIPATAFVFGYRPGSSSEAVYRQWYRTGYHRPQDDLAQPIDWKAAADFNAFFYALVDRVARRAAAPAWKPGSTLRQPTDN